MADYDFLYRVLLLGDSGVGKTNALLRYTDGLFSESFISTIGVDFKFSTIEHSGKRVKLQIWDTAGQDRFRSITRSFYRGSHAVVVVYDVTSRESFANVEQKWLGDIAEYAGKDVSIVLVGNKTDLDESRVVSTEEGAAFAAERGLAFLETSAKTGDAIEAVFTELVDVLLQNNKLDDVPKPRFAPVRINREASKPSKCAC